MAERGRRVGWIVAGVGGALLTAAGLAVGTLDLDLDLDQADKVSSVAGVVVGLISVALSAYAIARHTERPAPESRAPSLLGPAGSADRLTPTAAQLPPDIDDFAGRAERIERLEASIRRGTGPAIALSGVAGKAGVGKTTLAVHVAHRLREEFPGGQLYCNLRGAGDRRLAAADVLGDFLRALGMPAALVPPDIEGRSTAFREMTADRRLLVVLDNAFDEDQVRPLLPGTSTSAVLITSRRPLTAIPGLDSHLLDVMTMDEARQMFARIVGPERVAAESAAADALIRVCGNLPLAIRIIGSRLTLRRHWTLRQALERMRDEKDVLSELAVGDLEVRASLEISYRELSPRAARAYRLLSLLAFDDFPMRVAVAALGTPARDAEDAVEQLVDAQLLDIGTIAAGGAAHYRFHDLVRLYGRELAHRDHSEQERDRVLRQVAQAYVDMADEAHSAITAGGDDPVRNPSAC